MCKAIWGTTVLRKRRNHSLPEEAPPQRIRRFRHLSSLELDLSRQFCRRLAVRASPRSGLADPWNRRSSQCDSLHSSKTKLIASTDKALKPTSSHGLLAIRPSSAFRPFGHQPPHSMPLDNAQSRAALSAPVCPPETILGMYVLIGQVYLVAETFSRIWCRDWPSELKAVRSINRLVPVPEPHEHNLRREASMVDP
jgi:hypothetical protein